MTPQGMNQVMMRQAGEIHRPLIGQKQQQKPAKQSKGKKRKPPGGGIPLRALLSKDHHACDTDQDKQGMGKHPSQDSQKPEGEKPVEMILTQAMMKEGNKATQKAKPQGGRLPGQKKRSRDKKGFGRTLTELGKETRNKSEQARRQTDLSGNGRQKTGHKTTCQR